MAQDSQEPLTRSRVSPVGGIYTTEEAAELLRTSKRTVHRLIRQGKLGAHRVGHGYRILDKHIQAFFADQEAPAPAAEPPDPTTTARQ